MAVLNKLIDRSPPVPTGNPKVDCEAMASYLAYYQEQTNYILTLIYRKVNKAEEE